MDRHPDVSLVATRSDGERSPRRIDGARREQLLDGVQEIVLAEGFRHLTVDDLASRLQCSKSTLYAVASSKESLVATVLKRFLDDVGRKVDAAVGGVADPVEALETYLTAIGGQMTRMSRMCFADMGANDRTRDVYFEHSRRLRRRIGEFVDAGMETSRFDAVDAAFVADAVSMLIDGIQWGRLLEDTQLSTADAYDAMTRFVVAALTNRRARSGTRRSERSGQRSPSGR
jgi:AcrR family transcriptional regulator